MRFHVVGGLRDTGEDVEFDIEAESAEEAAATVNKMAVLVEHVAVVLDNPLVVQQPAAPPARPVEVRPVPAVQTIEATGKQWKAIQLVSALCAMGGLVTVIVAPTTSVGGSAALFLGICGYIVGRVGGWWHHG